MTKKIYWIYKGRKYNGVAEMEDKTIYLRDKDGVAFTSVDQSEIENGMTIQELFDDIPENVTNYPTV